MDRELRLAFQRFRPRRAEAGVLSSETFELSWRVDLPAREPTWGQGNTMTIVMTLVRRGGKRSQVGSGLVGLMAIGLAAGAIACDGSVGPDSEDAWTNGGGSPAVVGPENAGAQAAAGVAGGGGVSPSTTAGGAAPESFSAAAAVLRRLTRSQISNAVYDLLGAEVVVGDAFEDSYDGVFATVGAATVTIAETGVEAFNDAVEDAVSAAFADSTRSEALLGCVPQMVGEACVRGFLEGTGRRAWRRPLATEEVDQLITVAETAQGELGDVVEGVKWATVALLGSPNFLYRAELGEVGADGQFRFTPYETASRLSFLIWNSVPDESLLADAENGTLDTKEGIRATVERMLATSKGRAAAGEFAEQYLRTDRVLTQFKDPELFPEYTPALQEAIVRDMRGVWEANAFDDQASVMDVFTTDKAVVNASLARVYGIDDSGLTDETFELRSLPPDSPRRGVLSKLGFLSQHANQKEGSPTLRGKFIREAIMCLEVPKAPGDVVPIVPPSPPGQPMTKRQRLDMHRTEPRCAACHELFDPMGLPLESFDAMGRYREMDEGLPVDPSGTFDGVPVADSVELGEVVASSERVARCLVQHYYSYAVGHEIRPGDASVIDGLKASFEASGYRLKDLIVEVASSDAFAAVAPQAD